MRLGRQSIGRTHEASCDRRQAHVMVELLSLSHVIGMLFLLMLVEERGAVVVVGEGELGSGRCESNVGELARARPPPSFLALFLADCCEETSTSRVARAAPCERVVGTISPSFSTFILRTASAWP